MQIDRKTKAATDRLLTEQELAQRQGRAVKTLQNDRVFGRGVPFVKLGRSVRYRLSDVLAYEDAHLCNSTSASSSERKGGRS